MPKLLLVEDYEMNPGRLSRRPAGSGVEILCARDGREGVGTARDESPSLLPMELSLPVADGREALHHLRLDRRAVRIPVIALTVHALVTHRRNPMDAGFDDCESELIASGRFVRTIHRIVTPGLLDDSR